MSIRIDIETAFEQSAYSLNMQQSCFRPDTSDAMEIVEYLSETKGSPFTREEQKVFDLANKTDKAATTILKWFTVPGVALAGGGSLLQLTGLISLAHPSLAETTLLASSIGGFFVGTIGGGLVYLSTGFLPHWASRDANPAQNVLETARDTFAAVVRQVSDVYYSDDQTASNRVKTCIEKINLDYLEQRSVEDSGLSIAVNIINPLRVLKKHITKSPEPCLDLRGVSTHMRMAALEHRLREREPAL